MKVIKCTVIIFVLALVMFILEPLFCFAQSNLLDGDSLEKGLKAPRAQQVVQRAQIEWEADQLSRNGKYEAAIKKYLEALKPQYISKIQDKNAALNGLCNAYQLLGVYEEAYKYNEEKININKSKKRSWLLKSEELRALIVFQATRQSKMIYDVISQERDVFNDPLELKNDDWHRKGFFRKSLYLYEIIEDYDAALKLCDEYLAMKKVKKDKKFKAEVVELRATVLEAKQTRQKNVIFKKLNQYGFYNWL